eukprot:jgi/Mesvir1/22396/Mv17884-RA.1
MGQQHERSRVCVVTSNRADWSKLEPLVAALHEDSKVELQLLVIGCHLLMEFGWTVETIRARYPVSIATNTLVAGDSSESMVDSVAMAMIKLSSNFRQLRPDIVVVHGDRYDAFAAVSAASLSGIRVLHLEGGELSGSADGVLRHAITKLAHFHLVCNEEARRRVLQLGEHPSRVCLAGCPSYDVLLGNVHLPMSRSEDEVLQHYSVEPRKFLLVQHHPDTNDMEASVREFRIILTVATRMGLRTLLFYPNTDPGNKALIAEIHRFLQPSRRSAHDCAPRNPHGGGHGYHPESAQHSGPRREKGSSSESGGLDGAADMEPPASHGAIPGINVPGGNVPAEDMPRANGPSGNLAIGNLASGDVASGYLMPGMVPGPSVWNYGHVGADESDVHTGEAGRVAPFRAEGNGNLGGHDQDVCAQGAEGNDHSGLDWKDVPITGAGEGDSNRAQESRDRGPDSGENVLDMVADRRDVMGGRGNGLLAVDGRVAAPQQLIRPVTTMPFPEFAVLMRSCGCMVGNSSAGTREACALGVPSISIGGRQANRAGARASLMRLENVTEANLEAALKDNFGKRFEPTLLYGDGNATSRFMPFLHTALREPGGMNKPFVDLEAVREHVEARDHGSTPADSCAGCNNAGCSLPPARPRGDVADAPGGLAEVMDGVHASVVGKLAAFSVNEA